MDDTASQQSLPNTVGSYVYDEKSGFYYDSTSGLYYDPKTKYYYNPTDQNYYFWNEETQQYDTVPKQGANDHNNAADMNSNNNNNNNANTTSMTTQMSKYQLINIFVDRAEIYDRHIILLTLHWLHFLTCISSYR